MSEAPYLPEGPPESWVVEREKPRRLRWLLGLLAFALATALLLTVLTRSLLPDRTSWGSGILLGGGYVLTCEHVVRDGRHITVYWDGSAYSAELVVDSQERDLALLNVEELEANGIHWNAWRTLGSGDLVAAVGYPAGQSQPVTMVGDVLRVGAAALTPADAWLDDLVFVQGAYERGMSGAPLVNLWGELVGVVSGSILESEGVGVGFAVSANTARRWLASAAPQLQLSQTESASQASVSRATDAAREVVVRLQVAVWRR